MTVRMIRYGMRTAFENYYIDDGIVHIPFPDIAVLYLRGSGNEKIESSRIKVDFPKSSTDYDMKILRLKRYSIDELFEKKLYVLLPFALFLFESELKKADSDAEKLERLMNIYHEIISRLEEARVKDDITDYEMSEVLQLLKYVSDHLAQKYKNIVKGVDSIMGGQLLEFDTTKAYHDGENRLSKLINMMMEKNMISEITKVTTDSAYRNEMYKKFGI